MTTFKFYQDSVVNRTERSHFSIIAASYQEALKRIQGFRDNDVDNHYQDDDIIFGTFESLYENSRKLSPDEHGGMSTITIYNKDTEGAYLV